MIFIEKNIGKIFRDVNIIEYKSPRDYIAVWDFYKVYCYSYLYIFLNKTPVTNITITFASSHYPRKLLRHLKKIHGYTVEENNPGIYTIKGDILPIQIINRQKLSAKENLWLKCLGSELDHIELDQLWDEMQRRPKLPHLEPYLDVLIKANPRIFKEGIKIGKRTSTLEDVFINSGLAAEAEARGEIIGEARGEAKKALDVAREMVNYGLPLEAIITITKLEPETIRKMYK